MTGKKSLCIASTSVPAFPHTESNRRRHAPEEIEESERLDNHAHERPLEEDEEDAADEADGAAELLFPREEVEGLLRADDEGYAGEKEELFGRCGVSLVL